MGCIGVRAAIVAGVIVFAGEFSHAQVPERATATYGDWTAICVQPSDGQKVCELAHAQFAEGITEPVGQITIGRASKAEPLKLFVQIPPNVWLGSGVRLVLDDKDPGIALTLRWCTSARCHADAELTDATVKLMRAQSEPGRVEFKEASERDVATSVSFRGFAAALAYLEKQ